LERRRRWLVMVPPLTGAERGDHCGSLTGGRSGECCPRRGLAAIVVAGPVRKLALGAVAEAR